MHKQNALTISLSYQHGQPVRKIAREFLCSEETVRRYVKTFGIRLRKAFKPASLTMIEVAPPEDWDIEEDLATATVTDPAGVSKCFPLSIYRKEV